MSAFFKITTMGAVVAPVVTIGLNLMHYWQQDPPFTTPPISLTNNHTYTGNLISVIGYNITAVLALIVGIQVAKAWVAAFWPLEKMRIFMLVFTWIIFSVLVSIQGSIVLQEHESLLKQQRKRKKSERPFLWQHSPIHAGSAAVLFLLILVNCIQCIRLYRAHNLPVPFARYFTVFLHISGFFFGPTISEFAQKIAWQRFRHQWTDVDDVNMAGLCQYLVVSSLFVYTFSFLWDRVVCDPEWARKQIAYAQVPSRDPKPPGSRRNVKPQEESSDEEDDIPETKMNEKQNAAARDVNLRSPRDMKNVTEE